MTITDDELKVLAEGPDLVREMATELRLRRAAAEVRAVVKNSKLTPEQVEALKELGREQLSRTSVVVDTDQAVADRIADWFERRCAAARASYRHRSIPREVEQAIRGEEAAASIIRSGAPLTGVLFSGGGVSPAARSTASPVALLRAVMDEVQRWPGVGLGEELERQVRAMLGEALLLPGVVKTCACGRQAPRGQDRCKTCAGLDAELDK